MIKGIKNMDEINEEGGAAFPSLDGDEAFPGMTLRDWFAGQALVGVLAGYPEDTPINPQMAAEFSMVMANAMMEARK